MTDETLPPVLDWAVSISMALFYAAMALAFVRILIGPYLADRVVALDLLAVLLVGLMALYTVQTGYSAFLDVAIMLALVGFLATVAFALYGERRHMQQLERRRTRDER